MNSNRNSFDIDGSMNHDITLYDVSYPVAFLSNSIKHTLDRAQMVGSNDPNDLQ